ncbi:MAG: hypothetical protein PHW15_01645 [Patescibacteria group bacterium]|jgi:heat-inducible transcriptional repressor|nr:hypothetical protein [Patescibacteria group bacterium]MDD5172998.1 hypothetical protein [Patescibacteria group bacterium]
MKFNIQEDITERQQGLIKNIIEEYVEKAQPIGSEFLSEKTKPRISSATIRNEMVDLVKNGYLEQPHLSAGKIPTLKGWQYYLNNLLIEESPSIYKNNLSKIKIKKDDQRMIIKFYAKKISELSGQLCILAFSNNDFYYTGLSNLLSQPEFTDRSVVHNLSQVIDHLDKILSENFDFLGKETKILVGKENPFGDFCGAIFTHLKFIKKYILIGILGPVRMNYRKNLALIKRVQELIN